MRREVVTPSAGEIKVIYPDEVCFAFNPNYLELRTSVTPLTVRVALHNATGAIVRSKSIKVSLYGSKTTVYLSRLFELMFQEPEYTRSLKLTVSVMSDNSATTYFSFDTIVIWGGIAPGERFNALGVFQDDSDKRQFERNLIWFRNFPFQVSAFKYDENVMFQGRFDGGMYGSPFNGTRPTHLISEIDDFSTPGTISTGTLSAPSRLVFFASTQQLLAVYTTGSGKSYYSKWNAANGFSASTAMVDGSGRPLTNVDYVLNGITREVYRYDGANMVYCGLQQNSGFVTLYPKDLFPSAKRVATLKYQIGENLSFFSTFDKTFDYTFFKSGQTLALINLTISDETAGHYLRWIDTQGNLQFYLFKKGKRTSKTTLGSNNIVVKTPLRGMYFSNMQRNTNVTVAVTHKVGAVSLPADVFEWVSTIITSPVIDMYLGKDMEGNEIWVPVTIQSSTIEYDNKKELNDLEITFQAPAHTAQSL